MMAFLTSRITSMVAAPLALVFALALGVQTVRLTDANKALTTAGDKISSTIVDLATARAGKASLQAAVDEQNAALEKMKSDAAVREATRQLADQRVDQALSSAVGALAAAKPTTDKCASASALIREFAK